MSAIGVGEKSATVIGATFQVSLFYNISPTLELMDSLKHCKLPWIIVNVSSLQCAVVSEGFHWDAWRHIVHILSGTHTVDSPHPYTLKFSSVFFFLSLFS